MSSILCRKPRSGAAENYATEQLGWHLELVGAKLAALGREIKARELIDDADVEIIRPALATAKITLDQIEAEVSAPDSKVRQVAPVHDGSAVVGGIFDGPVGVARV